LKGTPADVLLEAALALNAAPIKEVVSHSRLDPASAKQALQELMVGHSLIPLEDGEYGIGSDLLIMALPRWNSLCDTTLQIVGAYHKSYPLRRGIPREELKSRLKLSPRLFNALVKRLAGEGIVSDRSAFLARPEHQVIFDHAQKQKVQVLMRRFEQDPFSPPGVKECQAEVGVEVLNALIDLNELTLLSPDIVFRSSDYEEGVARIRETLLQKDTITLAEVRDLLNTSRKYAQALLEHLDASGVTIREGDYRRLKK
jgi:selenocysteine-specific elongation factor